MKLITGAYTVGDAYKKFARISLPSFLRANPDCDLVYFCEKPEEETDLRRFKRIIIEDYFTWFNRFPDLVKKFDEKTEHARCDFQYPGYKHVSIYQPVWVSILQSFALVRGYEWCLSVDVDSYFIGRLIERLDQEMEFVRNKHFFCVEQSHPEMQCFDPNTGKPTAGFLLWKIDSPFCERYCLSFNWGHQATFWMRLEDGQYLRFIKLLWPGYHFVYPFNRNGEFSKADALRWSPAYFHLGGGLDTMAQLKTMDEWFNPERRDA